MKQVIWKRHIIIDPKIHHGDPCIKGTRIPVSIIVGSLGDGMTEAELRREYPQLKTVDIQAALQYAAEVMKTDVLLPLS